jgi:7-cyano-7-deazaguanine synthase in queuosine biosynthesis
VTKFVCGPRSAIEDVADGASPVLLYEHSEATQLAGAGAAVKQSVRRRKLAPSAVAWDLLSVALSVVVADTAVKRSGSPDGWTREIELSVATIEPELWNSQAQYLAKALGFLTTDIWMLDFMSGGARPETVSKPEYPTDDAIVLLSGGLDSLVGAIDLNAVGRSIFAVSQTVRGDSEIQRRFAKTIGGGLRQLQLNHNAGTPRSVKETSQRSRSLIFFAFATLAATALEQYRDGERVPLYICENGLISINPPLTDARLGSLSTRTAHPSFLARMQLLFDELSLRIDIVNPYAEKTKGEMLKECLDQDLLTLEASASTSCGRYQRYNYHHCGRCIPCQIRRASFLEWGTSDDTLYVYEDLGRKDEGHAGFDDVRSVAMALALVEEDGLDRWLGNSLSSPHISNREALRSMAKRGLGELQALHAHYGVS